jgi:pyruvate/2-oxoglutarate dehydrogenase complex dihydrolipoamide dehydrogenase (E3) component
MQQYDVIVVGGGPAGVTAAMRARELGAQVVLVERERMGGTCTNDGCVPTRVLAHAARLARDSRQYTDYGLIGAPPSIDFSAVIDRTQRMVYRIHEKKQLVGNLRQAGVQVIAGNGSAKFVDEHTLALPDAESMQAEKFILAAGGHARRFPFPGSDYALTHSDIWSLKQLPASVAIVGGAATGCQLASIFSDFGSKVWLLERGEQILSIEDPAITRVIMNSFEQRGIQIITSINGVDRIERKEKGLELCYNYQGESLGLEVEAVLLAVGWIGNIEDLNLEAAGVQTERNYIVVDDYLRTSAPHIFAAGDITGRMMLVQSGSYEGRIAAENAVLGVGQPYRHIIVPHGGFTDPEYGSVGLTEEIAHQANMDIVTVEVPYEDLDRAVIDGHTEGVCKLIVSQETHRILGAHIVGEQALESIQLVAAGMAADMWVEQLAELELAYPTYTAVVGLAARQIMLKLGVLPLAPQWRALKRPHAEWERSQPAD